MMMTGLNFKMKAYIAIVFTCIALSEEGSAIAHPRCDVAQDYATLRSRYAHVVIGEARMSRFERSASKIDGVIVISKPRFLKWPHSEARPVEISVPFSYDYEVECDWYPNISHKKFILDQVSGKFIVISSFGK